MTAPSNMKYVCSLHILYRTFKYESSNKQTFAPEHLNMNQAISRHLLLNPLKALEPKARDKRVQYFENSNAIGPSNNNFTELV